MMPRMGAAGVASDHVSPRVIGLWSGVLSSSTAIFWAWGNLAGRLPEPALEGVQPDEVEVHGDQIYKNRYVCRQNVSALESSTLPSFEFFVDSRLGIPVWRRIECLLPVGFG